MFLFQADVAPAYCGCWIITDFLLQSFVPQRWFQKCQQCSLDMPHLSIHTLVKRKCSHHLTDCPDSLICLEKEYKMFVDTFKKLPNTVCRWKKIDRNSHYIKGSSDKIANVARAPDDIATIIFFEDPFWSHKKRLRQCFRWD